MTKRTIGVLLACSACYASIAAAREVLTTQNDFHRVSAGIAMVVFTVHFVVGLVQAIKR